MAKAELFFQGFKFKPITRVERPVLGKPVKLDQVEIAEPIKVPQVEGETGLEEVQVGERIGWTQKAVLSEYDRVLFLANRNHRTSLVRSGRGVRFVDFAELNPTAGRQADYLKARYGPDIIGTIIGDCFTVAPGRYRLRLGYLGTEGSVTAAEVLGTLFHEHGHTLGFSIKMPVYEEMKAYACEALLMATRNNWESYDIDGTNPQSIHDVARNKIAQLTRAGINEQEIIAHLTSRPFGGFRPSDWQKHMGLRRFAHRH